MANAPPRLAGLKGEKVAQIVEGNRCFALVAKPGSLTLYVRDHGKPASTEGATAKMTLLNGMDKLELALTPAGGGQGAVHRRQGHQGGGAGYPAGQEDSERPVCHPLTPVRVASAGPASFSRGGLGRRGYGTLPP